MKAGGTEGAAALDKLAASALNLKNNVDPTERGINNLAAKIKSLSPEAATDKLNKLALAVEKAGGASVKGAAQIEFLQKRIEKLSSAGGAVPASLQGIAKSASGLSDAMAQLSSRASGLGGVETGLVRAGSAALGLSAGMAAGVTAGIALGAVSIKVASDFETAFARVKRVVTPNVASIGELRDGLIEMSTKIPVAATELASIASMGAQMGITGTANLLKFTEVVARLGPTADMSGEQAAIALAKIANVSGIPTSKIENLASATLAVSTRFNATTEEVLRMTQSMQGLASIAGLSAQEMLGLSAVMASGGLRMESGATAMGRMARDISNAVNMGGKKLQEFAFVSNMTAEEFQKSWREDKATTLYRFFKGLADQGDGASRSLQELGLQGVRVAATAGVLAKSYEDVQKAIKIANDGFEQNTELTRMSNEMFGTFESSLTRLKESFKAIGIAIGTGPMHEMQGFVDQLTTTLNAIRHFYADLPEWAKKLLDGSLNPVNLSVQAGKNILAGASNFIGKNLLGSGADLDEEMAKLRAYYAARDMAKASTGSTFNTPDSHVGLWPGASTTFGGSTQTPPMSEEEKKALEDYTRRKIQLEKEYSISLGKTEVGLEAVKAAINAKAVADKAVIATDEKLDDVQKKSLQSIVEKTRVQDIANAADAEQQKIAKEQAVQDAKAASLKEKLTKQVEQLHLSQLKGIAKEEEAHKFRIRDMQAELDLLKLSDPVKAASMQAMITQLKEEGDAKIQNMKDTAAATFELHRLEKQYDADVAAAERMEAQQQRLGGALAEFSKELTALNGLLEAFGMSGDAAFGKVVGSIAQGADTMSRSIQQGYLSYSDMLNTASSMVKSKDALGSAIQGGMIGSMFGPMGAAVGAGAGIVLGTVGSMFKSRGQKVMEDIGLNWGTKVSDATVKAIEETMDKQHVSKAMAELLNVSKIIEDSGSDPARYANKIGDLMNAVKLHSVDAKSGVAELGTAFDKLKVAAEGGSVASEKAMIQMIRRARELGLEIPEMQAAIKGFVSDAVTNLKDIFAGQGSSVGKNGEMNPLVSAEQSNANQLIFGAVFEADAALNGIVQAAEDTKDAFEALNAGLAKGTALTGGAAQAALINEALKNPMFKGAALSSTAAGKTLGALEKADMVSQSTLDAFGITLKSNMAQALKGTEGLNLSEDQQRKLAEEANLPLLTQMQHAEALGLTLSPESREMLAQAQKDGVLPALSLQEQQLGVLKQIATNTGKSWDGDKNGNSTGGSTGINVNAGFIPPIGDHSGDRYKHYARGGIVPFTPGGGRHVIAGENEDELIIPRSRLGSFSPFAVPGFGGLNSSGVPGGGSNRSSTYEVRVSFGDIRLDVPSNLDAGAVGEKLADALLAGTANKLRGVLIDLQTPGAI